MKRAADRAADSQAEQRTPTKPLAFFENALSLSGLCSASHLPRARWLKQGV